MKIIFKILIALILLTSCIQRQETTTGLSEPQRIIGTKNLEHFPKYMKYKWITGCYRIPSEFYPERNAGAYYQQVYKPRNKRQLEELKEDLVQGSKYTLSHTGDCVIWINRGKDDPAANDSSKCNTIIPVPHFLEQMMKYGVEDYSGLPEDFTLFVLEVAKGNFLKEESLWPNSKMPDEWTHGLSRGVAFSYERREAIYWVDIW